MASTYRERILDYLWSVSPEPVTNSQIQHGAGVKSHQQVYLLTQELLTAKRINGEQRSNGWVFWSDETAASQLTPPGPPLIADRTPGTALSPAAFEDMARNVLSKHYGVPLAPGRAPGVPKLFDLASADWQVVGDAKYFSMVGGERMPPAKFSVIAEHVWLLEKTGASKTFLIFGHDWRVPEIWLKRYGHLARQVVFYFLSDDGQLYTLSAGDKPE